MKTASLALILLLAAPLLALAPAAQEEPPLFDAPAPESEPPAPETPPGEAPPAAPKAPLPPPEPPEPPRRPLSERLDFARWQEMTPRERQTYVEGAVAALASVMVRLRSDVAGNARATPDRGAALGRFITEHSPRRAASLYLREMYNIYHTEEGRALSVPDCFLKAYQRLNAQ
jgi:hypothetical protein